MGSSSDWETMQHAVQILQQFGITHEARVVSAHRMPDDMFAYAEAAAGRGIKAIIAARGSTTVICPSKRITAPATRGLPCRTQAALTAWRVA